MDKWKELREKFFKEHTTTMGNEENQLRKVITTPHDLFEWFKKELEAEKGSQPSDAVKEEKVKHKIISILEDCTDYSMEGMEFELSKAVEQLYQLFKSGKPSIEDDLDVTGKQWEKDLKDMEELFVPSGKNKDSASVASHTSGVGNSIEQGEDVLTPQEFIAKTKAMLKHIYDGYSNYVKHEVIPDSTCSRCGGFLYIEQGGVGDVDCPSCKGTGMEHENGFDAEGFSEFIEHGVMFGNQPFLELIECSIKDSEDNPLSWEEYSTQLLNSDKNAPVSDTGTVGNSIGQARLIAYEAWKSAANTYRMYPDNKHTFHDYWENYGKKLKINTEL